jgi:hypothetical protein
MTGFTKASRKGQAKDNPFMTPHLRTRKIILRWILTGIIRVSSSESLDSSEESKSRTSWLLLKRSADCKKILYKMMVMSLMISMMIDDDDDQLSVYRNLNQWKKRLPQRQPHSKPISYPEPALLLVCDEERGLWHNPFLSPGFIGLPVLQRMR